MNAYEERLGHEIPTLLVIPIRLAALSSICVVRVFRAIRCRYTFSSRKGSERSSDASLFCKLDNCHTNYNIHKPNTYTLVDYVSSL